MNNFINLNHNKTPAFTLIEVLVALAVVSIAIVALLGLQLISINLTQRAGIGVQAALLAEEKMEESLAGGYSQIGPGSGSVRRGNFDLRWQTTVAAPRLPQLQHSEINELREVAVLVSWQDGSHSNQYKLSTLVADSSLAAPPAAKGRTP